MDKNKENRRRITAYKKAEVSFVDSEPLSVGVESIVTPEEVIRNEVGAADVERLREWNKENQL